MKNEKKYLTKKSEDISKWYGEVIEKAALADYSPVKGCMVIRPYGYAIWELVQRTIDAWFKEDGVQNAYFPVFVPYSLLQKEKSHIAGFSPELAVVTIGGGEKLAEPLVVRPTSEAIMYEMFSKWISSYKDLPLKINQWCNVVRWEKRTYPFLRTTEFLWQEGHTVHQTEDEAMEMVYKALQWYKDFYEKYMGIAVYVGEKSDSEKFAGAKRTFTIEIVIPNGKALQAATSHNLGQNFAKTFDLKFLDENNTEQNPFQTSWGLSTRSIGGLILSHGDDNGLIIPPKIAPYQVVIVAIEGQNEEAQKQVVVAVKKVQQLLKLEKLSYLLDNNFDKTIGYRLNDAEIKGIPLRIEIGSREAESDKVTISRRDTMQKEQVTLKNLADYISEAMQSMQDALYERSRETRDRLTVNVDSFDEFDRIMREDRKFIRAYWCESATCETSIKEKTKATTRLVELDEKPSDGTCIYCKNKARRRWLFAQSY